MIENYNPEDWEGVRGSRGPARGRIAEGHLADWCWSAAT